MGPTWNSHYLVKIREATKLRSRFCGIPNLGFGKGTLLKYPSTLAIFTSSPSVRWRTLRHQFVVSFEFNLDDEMRPISKFVI